MIRLMEIGDLDIVGEIVNGDWKNIYSSYINPDLLSLEGCKKEKRKLRQSCFLAVWQIIFMKMMEL